MNRVYTLAQEPKNLLYRAIIDFALDECELALLVIRKSLPMDEHCLSALKKLEPFLVGCNEASEWPGTKLYSEKALLHYYRLSNESSDLIKTLTKRLYGWVQPELPEDLCLMKDGKCPWLVTIAHEKDGYFLLTKEEKSRLIGKIPALKKLLIEETGQQK